MVYDLGNDEVVDYLKNGKELTSYSSVEMIHMQDVKRLIDDVNFIFYSLSFVFILLISYLVYKKERFFKEITKGCLLTILIIFILGLAFYFNFEKLFYYFHIIGFSNNYWMLEEGSLLLKQFPIDFFYNFVFNLLFRSLIIALSVLIIMKVLLKFKIIQ